jgi:hypothetical protein
MDRVFDRVRIPRHELIRRLLPIIEERGGIEIWDGDAFRVDPSPVAYQLAVATLISNFAEDAFPARDCLESSCGTGKRSQAKQDRVRNRPRQSPAECLTRKAKNEHDFSFIEFRGGHP